MAKIIPDGLQSLFDTPMGTEPDVVLEVEWVSGTKSVYTSRDSLLSLSGVEDFVAYDQSGSGLQLTVNLSDHDGVIRELTDAHGIFKKPCRIYQRFVDQADQVLLVDGETASPIEYDFENRVLRFDVTERPKVTEIGFSPESGMFPHNEDIGKVWPLCFGNVVHVPATRFQDLIVAQTAGGFIMPDATLALKYDMTLSLFNTAYNYFLKNIETYTSSRALAGSIIGKRDELINLIIAEDKNKQDIEDRLVEMQEIKAQIDELKGEYYVSDLSDEDQDELKELIEQWKLLRDGTPDPEEEEPEESAERQEYKDRIDTLTRVIYRQKYEHAKYRKDFMAGDIDIIPSQLRDTEFLVEHFYTQLVVDFSIEYLFTVDKSRPVKASILGFGMSENIPEQKARRNYAEALEFHATTISILVNIRNWARQQLAGGAGSLAYPVTEETVKGLRAMLLEQNTYELSKHSVMADSENLKNLFNYLKELRQIMAKQYTRLVSLQNDLLTIQRLMILQQVVSIPMVNSHRFPQNQALVLEVSNQRFLGTFNEGVLAVNKYLPTYTNVLFTKDADSLNGLILSDSGIRMDNMYALTDTGRIINITEQQGQVVKFSLVEKQSTSTFELDDTMETSLRDALGDLIAVGDSRAEIQKFLIEFQRKLSQAALDKLAGGPVNSVTLSPFDPEDKPDDFTLVIDGFETERQHGWEPLDQTFLGGILDKITNIPIYSHMKDTSLIAISGDENGIVITFDYQNWKEVYPRYMPSVEVANTDKLKVEYNSSGAHEYTRNERAELYDKLLRDNEAKAIYLDTKTRLRELWEDFASSGLLDDTVLTEHEKAEIAEIRDMISKFMETLTDVQKKLTSEVGLDDEDPERLIDDDEEATLLALEQLAYSFWILESKPLMDFEEKSYYITNKDFTYLREVSPNILPEWLPYYRTGNIADKYNELPATRVQYIQPGSEVTEGVGYKAWYVANILPSTVKAVSVRRGELLVPLPPSMYTIHTPTLGNIDPVMIGLVQPEDCWVTLDSSVGPNTVDIIRYVLETYTDLSCDDTTFDEVKTLVENYPSSFAVFTQPDAWEFVKDIAWQARLAIWTRGKKAYLRYLPKIPESVFTFDRTNVLQDSVRLGYTQDENLVTKLTVDWRSDYFNEPKQIIYRQNVSRYALSAETKDVFIYNIRDLVAKSAGYWLMRFSHIWREVSLSTGLDAMHIDKQDAVTIDIEGLPETIGIVQSVSYDPQNFKLDFRIWLPIREVDTEPWNFAFPYDVPQEYVADFSSFGNPNFPEVPSERDDLPNIVFTPQDYPPPKLNDIDDELPEAPTVHYVVGEEDSPENGTTVGQNSAAKKPKTDLWTFKAKDKFEGKRKPYFLGHGWIQERKEDVEYSEKEFEVLLSNGRLTTVTIDQLYGQDVPLNMPVTVMWDGFRRVGTFPTWVEDDIVFEEDED